MDESPGKPRDESDSVVWNGENGWGREGCDADSPAYRALDKSLEESSEPARAASDTPRHGVAAEAMQWPG